MDKIYSTSGGTVFRQDLLAYMANLCQYMHDQNHRAVVSTTFPSVINRPGVAGAVLQTPLSLIDSVSP